MAGPDSVIMPAYQNGTLGVGSAIAQGAQNFMSAYQGARQQAIQNDQTQQEITAKQQLYQLQAQKLQKEIQPVQINLEKVKAARAYFGDDSSFYKKAVNDALDSVQTPAQAQYLSSIATSQPGGGQPGGDSGFSASAPSAPGPAPAPTDGTGGMSVYGGGVAQGFVPSGQLPGASDGGVPGAGGMAPTPAVGNPMTGGYQTAVPSAGGGYTAPPQAQPFTGTNFAPRGQTPPGQFDPSSMSLNKDEGALLEKMISNDSASQYRQGMLGQRSNELDQKQAALQALSEHQNNQLQFSKMKQDQDAQMKQMEIDHKAQTDAINQRLKDSEAKLKEYDTINGVQTRGKQAQTEQDRATEAARHNKAEEDNAAAKLATQVKLARMKQGSQKAAMDETALNSGISEDYKALNKITTSKPGIMDDPDTQANQTATIQKQLYQKLDAWKATHGGVPHSLDLRPPVLNVGSGNPSAGYYGDGRVGPVAPGAGAQMAPIGQTGSVRVRNTQTGQTGTWNLSKGRPPAQYQVLGQ